MASTANRTRSARPRCAWALGSPLLTAYHDEEWGVPCHDDRTLFEFLILEGMQAGLTWEVILRKREHFRAAFDHFDPRKVARYGPARVRRLLREPGIVRNRAKIEAAIANAGAVLRIQEEFGSFDRFIWGVRPRAAAARAAPAPRRHPPRTAISIALSKELRRRGLRFVGPTICYAFMQAVGLVNDHTVRCFRYRQLAAPG